VEVRHGEGVATRIGPEPCIPGREARGEASRPLATNLLASFGLRRQNELNSIVPSHGLNYFIAPSTH
jgi:hypothetical protein